MRWSERAEWAKGEKRRVGEIRRVGEKRRVGEIRLVGEKRRMGEIRCVGEKRRVGEMSVCSCCAVLWRNGYLEYKWVESTASCQSYTKTI